MVYLDWNAIMAVTPDNFTEDDKEDLVETIVWYSPTPNINRDQLLQLIKVFQEILKHKVDQVESLMSALDELAGKQGEEVARARQELLDEAEDLREQLEYYRRMDTSSGASDDQLRSEVVRLEMQNEELLQELQEREKDLAGEKAEVEKLVADVARLEREKTELSRELAALQEEADSRHRRLSVDSPEEPEKLEQFVQLVRQKNKHIMQLLEDIETVEQENQSLRLKLTNTRDQLREANELATELTKKATVMQVALEDSERIVGEVKNQNKALATQVEELVMKKAKHDQDLDEFAVTLNSRVEDWQRLIDAKDAEISAVREQLEKYVSMNVPWSSSTSDSEFKAKLVEQEAEIVRVKTELLEAKKAKERQEEIVLQLKEKVTTQLTNQGLVAKIKEYEKEIENLQIQLKSAEDDATQRAEEITKLVVQVRAFEREEFGLTEAMDQLKKLDKKIKNREMRIEELIKACNMIEIEKGELEEENIYLKDKLGLSPTHQVDSSSIRQKFATNAETIKKLKEDSEKNREEVINLKLQNRQLLSQIKENFEKETIKEPKVDQVLVADQLSTEHLEELKALEVKYTAVVDENDGLRKGLHEILSGIQKSSLGAIEVRSVERLLEALDARHISGWYHPAMRLQAQVNTLKGEAKELRNQLRFCIDENKRLLEQKQSSLPELLEKPLEYETKTDRNEVRQHSVAEKIHFEEKCISLELELTNLRLTFEKSAADWESERKKLMKEEYCQRISSEPNALKEFFMAREQALEAELNELRISLFQKQEEAVAKITKAQNEKILLLNRIKVLEGVKSDDSSDNSYKNEMDQLTQIRVKMAEIVNFTLKLNPQTNIEIHDYRIHEEEKEQLLNELKVLKTKFIEAEALLNVCEKNVTPDAFNNQLSDLAKKLAESEITLSSESFKRKHYESINEFLTSERVLLDNQIKDLTNQISKLTEINGRLQLSVAETRDELQYLSLSPQDDVDKDLRYQVEHMKNKVLNLEELLFISRNQCRSLEKLQEARSLENDSLAECIALLQTSVGEKQALASLSQQLLEAKTSVLNMKSKQSQLESVIAKLTAENLEKERNCVVVLDEISNFKAVASSKFKLLHKFLYEVHSAFQNAVVFPSIESAYFLINVVKGLKSHTENKSNVIAGKENDLKIKEREFDIQLEGLQDLKAAFRGDSTNLVSWHNKTTDLRLRENRLMRENEQLMEQIKQLKGEVRNLNHEIALLEERCIKKEGELETRQLVWEKYQYELCTLLGSGGVGKIEPQPDLPAVSTEVKDVGNEVELLKAENQRLLTEMSQKEAVFKEKIKEKLYCGKSIELEEAGRKTPEVVLVSGPKDNGGIEPERIALKITVESLESILKQKEETIARYQETLKKAREDHGMAMRRLQGELRNVHNALAKQSKAYSRLQHGVYHSPSNVGFDKLVNKVYELEEELNEAQSNYTRVEAQLKNVQQESDKWKYIAEERLVLVDETRERMEMEVEHYREELHLCQMEAQEMRDGPQIRNLVDVIQDLQRKIVLHGERATARPISGKSQSDTDVRDKDNSAEVELLKRQLKVSKEECNRLRQQLRIARDMKRKPSPKAKPNQENLVDKIRELEEMLKLSKQHEQELQENGMKKIRSVEEVTRWDERKRYQKTLETLNAKLKQKEVEATVAVNKMETMRNLMLKMEREKTMLELHVKNITDSAKESSRIERMREEKVLLTSQVTALEEELAALRHANQPSKVLITQLEKQEQTIAALQLAAQSPGLLTTEIQRFQTTISHLEKDNVELESANLKLKLIVEQLREENEHLRQAHRKQPKPTPSRTESRFAYEAQREVNKLKGELKSLRDRSNATFVKNQELEDEVLSLRNQVQLWEEKDMATSLSKTSEQQLTSELHRELLQVKAQLTHKVYLLDKVKILLKKAAAKEKTLNDKVAALQTIVEARDT